METTCGSQSSVSPSPDYSCAQFTHVTSTESLKISPARCHMSQRGCITKQSREEDTHQSLKTAQPGLQPAHSGSLAAGQSQPRGRLLPWP